MNENRLDRDHFRRRPDTNDQRLCFRQGPTSFVVFVTVVDGDVVVRKEASPDEGAGRLGDRIRLVSSQHPVSTTTSAAAGNVSVIGR